MLPGLDLYYTGPAQYNIAADIIDDLDCGMFRAWWIIIQPSRAAHDNHPRQETNVTSSTPVPSNTSSTPVLSKAKGANPLQKRAKSRGRGAAHTASKRSNHWLITGGASNHRPAKGGAFNYRRNKIAAPNTDHYGLWTTYHKKLELPI